MLGRFGEGEQQQVQLLDRRQVAAVGLTLASMAAGLSIEFAAGGPAWAYQSLYLLGVLLLGGPIILNAARGLLRRHTNVDELVALALIASTATGHILEADVVATLMVLGSLFEQRASLRARRAIAQLLNLAPHEATRLTADGAEEDVPVSELKPSDRIISRAGQHIAADGIVEAGAAHVDQAAVTGESVPVYCREGDSVYAGTLALDGSVIVRVTRTGEDSTVGQIIKIVRDAEHYQAPVMRVVDQWARFYTPLILSVALLTLLIMGFYAGSWGRAISAAVAVMIVGCPCTIVLATPTAIIAAMGRAARVGVLVRDGAVLEHAAKVDTIIFDKTGTLTTGRHEVVSVIPAEQLKGIDEVIGLCPAMEQSVLKLSSPSPSTPGEGRGQDSSTASQKLLALAAAVEYHSNHPFARAIIEHARRLKIEFSPANDVKEIPGMGVQGRVNGQPVLVGKPEFVAQTIHNACLVPGTMIRPIRRYSVIAVEVAGTYAGALLLRDALRPAAESVIDELRETGLKNLAVLSGDHSGAVKLVAQQLKLDQAFSGLLPGDKAGQVKALREQGHIVAFVGDGINDAPALATADIGIAMGGGGADLAIEAADVVLLHDRIELLAILFNLARRTRHTIYMNLFFGVMLNIAALALASSGILSPMMGALVHNAGSVIIVGNSARLAMFRRRVGDGALIEDAKAPAETSRAA